MRNTQLHLGVFTRSVLLQVARVTGALERAGLEVKESLVQSSPSQFQSLANGELDLIATSPDNAIAYRFLPRNPLGRKLPVKILAAIDRGQGLSLCIAPGLNGIEDVRGRVLGVDVPRSGFAFAAYALLEQAGLLPGDYDIQSFGPTPQRVDALIAGDCAASILNAGNELRAATAGCATIGRATNLGPYIGSVIAAMSTEDPAREAAHLRFIDVFLETAEEIVSGRLEAKAIEQAMVTRGLSKSEAEAHYEVLCDPSQGYISSGLVDRASISTLVRIRQLYSPSPEIDSVQDSLNELVIQRALDQVGS